VPQVPRKRLGIRWNLSVAYIATVVIAIDAAVKAWLRHDLPDSGWQITNGVRIKMQYNTGLSFSMSSTHGLVVALVTLVVAGIVLGVGLGAARGLPTIGFGLLVGGGLANQVDRFSASPHEVTDYIALGSFPVFNLADIAVTVGVVLLLIAVIQNKRLMAT
jgi:signal peptidase II